MDMPAMTPSHSPASSAVTAAENPTGITSYSNPWSSAMAFRISRSIPTISPLSFSNSNGAKVVSVLITYFLPAAGAAASVPAAAVSSAFAAVVSAWASVAAAVSAAGLDPHPAIERAITAAIENAMIFFIMISSSNN